MTESELAPATDRDLLRAFADRRDGEAFAVLGPHQTAAGDWEIRAWLPHASAAWAGGVPMERIEPAGFFVATLNKAPQAYRMRIELPDGRELDLSGLTGEARAKKDE